jgi:serine/threonine-protein kinase PknK
VHGVSGAMLTSSALTLLAALVAFFGLRRLAPTPSVEPTAEADVIRQEFPETAILVLSAHVEVERAMELLASGRRIGYLHKSRVTDVEEFIETLQRIAKGRSVIDPALVQELVTTGQLKTALTA